MAAADPYNVKHVEPVLKSSNVLVRIFTLAPGDIIPWHYHLRRSFLCPRRGDFDLNTRTRDEKKAVGRTKP
jgi:quercetin dioxygenase-like cupin family protein